jgi:hypothetical protein
VKAELYALLVRGERVLELVAVAEDRHRGDDRLERRLRKAADPDERVAHLALLLGQLHLVREVLEAAAAADAEVPTGSVHAMRAALENLRHAPLREPAFDLAHPRPHAVAGNGSAHEDDEPVDAADAVPAVGERVDSELELLAFPDGCGHDGPA